jgi:hypothetical protein
MKYIDLNIKMDQPIFRNKEQTEEEIKNKKPIEKIEIASHEIALKWIQNMLDQAINKPDPKTGRPTTPVTMEVHRKYNRVMDALEAHKEGIAQLEDDDYKFLNSKYHQAELGVQREISKVLDRISDAITKAKDKVEEKNG